MKKRKAKYAKPARCPYCNAPMIFRKAAEIYRDPTRMDCMYVCNRYPICNTYVGTHSGTAIPLGTPANKELRILRIKAHKEFDKLWKQNVMSRDLAYQWLADYLGLKRQDAHIGMCGEYQCKALIEKCQELRLFRDGHSM